VSAHTFYNPDLVAQLAACGITSRPAARSAGTPAQGFVLEGRRAPARAREAVTNVIAVQGNVTITGPRQSAIFPEGYNSAGPRLPADRQLAAPPAATAPGPQTALELVDECERLRRDNRRLSDEVARLRGEVARLSGAPPMPPRQDQPADDAAARFALLELD
jgi:hypothetical protein